MTFGMDNGGRMRPFPVVVAGLLLTAGTAYLGFQAYDALKAGQTAPAAIARLELSQRRLEAKVDTILATLNGLPAQAERINALDARSEDRWNWTREELKRLREAIAVHENRPHGGTRP